MSLIILQVIPSLIGYILVVQLFNCATWSLFPEHHFRRWAKLTSIFIVISFRLVQQSWFRVCVVLVVPITFRFIIPLTWCHRRWIAFSWNLSTNMLWSSQQFWALLGYQSNSWWEIPSLPPRWIFAKPVGPILIFSLLKLYDLFYNLFPMDPLCSQGPIFTWWPCQCYPEAWLWYSEHH